jgi:hypothetical protein
LTAEKEEVLSGANISKLCCCGQIPGGSPQQFLVGMKTMERPWGENWNQTLMNSGAAAAQVDPLL